MILITVAGREVEISPQRCTCNFQNVLTCDTILRLLRTTINIVFPFLRAACKNPSRRLARLTRYGSYYGMSRIVETLDEDIYLLFEEGNKLIYLIKIRDQASSNFIFPFYSPS